MASFHRKIGWKSPRKRKNKNYRSVRSYTMRNKKFQKKTKKIQKVKKHHYGFFSNQQRSENTEKERK